MKLSKREKIMLAILGTAVICVSFYMLILNPRLDELNKYKEKVEVLQRDVDMTKANIELISEVDMNYKKVNEKILAITETFFPSLVQEQIIVDINDFLEISKVDGKTVSFTEIQLNEIGGDVKNNRGVNLTNELDEILSEYNMDADVSIVESQQGSVSGISLKSINAQLYLHGKYEDYLKLIEEIENFEKNIIIKNLNLVKEEGVDELAGSMNLQFYSVPQLEGEETFEWDYDNKYGNGNPFIGKSAYVNKTIPKTLDNYDFSMLVNFLNADNPTIILGRFGDTSRKTYVYGDNIGIEPVNITLKQEGDKYLYRYTTSIEAYPQNQDVYNEFAPKGKNIDIRIYSTVRNGSNDVSGAKVNIKNLTDKIVTVDIVGDDVERPRVNIITQDGEVVINRD